MWVNITFHFLLVFRATDDFILVELNIHCPFNFVFGLHYPVGKYVFSN